MHILICSATQAEIEPLIQYLKAQPRGQNHTIRVVITGVGGVATAYHLAKAIADKTPEYIIQAGIAGTFNSEVPPGSVVLVYEEIIADSGVVENGSWKDLFDLNLADGSKFPFTDKKLINPHTSNWKNYDLPIVRSVSVSEISTTDKIKMLQEKYVPVVESMEGAAFHYVCIHEKIPFMQIRGISNHIGERDKITWKMEDAISNLNKELIRLIQTIA